MIRYNKSCAQAMNNHDCETKLWGVERISLVQTPYSTGRTIPLSLRRSSLRTSTSIGNLEIIARIDIVHW